MPLTTPTISGGIAEKPIPHIITPPTSKTGRVLEASDLFLTALQSVADFTSIPYLKQATDLTLGILQSIEVRTLLLPRDGGLF